MTTIEQEPTIADGDNAEEWRPIAHIPLDPKAVRPTVALCGAPMLGILAEGDFETCSKCEKIMDWIKQK
jgi:hypothetical protein